MFISAWLSPSDCVAALTVPNVQQRCFVSPIQLLVLHHRYASNRATGKRPFHASIGQRASHPLSESALTQPAQENFDTITREIEARFPAWADSGFIKGEAPSAQVAESLLSRATSASLGLSQAVRVSRAKDRRIRGLVRVLFGPQESRQSQSSHLHGFNDLQAGGVARVLWGLCMLGGDILYEAEVELLLLELAEVVDDLTLQEVGQVCYGLALARHWTQLLGRLAERAYVRGGRTAIWAKPALCGRLLYSFATFNYAPHSLLSWRPVIKKRVASFSEEQLVACLWPLAVLQEVNGGIFRACWVELGTRGEFILHNSSYYNMVYQVALAIRLEGKASAAWQQGLPESAPVLLSAKQVWDRTTAQSQGSSNHRDVCKCLTSLGRSYTSEDCSSGYAVDIAIPESRIAIEVDGPTHFTRNTLMPLGATAMKHRHLRKLGWKVLSLSYATWYELEDRAEKCRYLREALSRLEQ